MKLAKKLACLALAGVIALAQVPVMSLAGAKKNSHEFRFRERSITITEKKQLDLSEYLDNETDVFQVSFTSSDDNVAKVSDELLEVVGNGTATITAKVDKTTEETVASTSTASRSTTSVITDYIATMTIKVELPEDEKEEEKEEENKEENKEEKKDKESSSDSSSDSDSSSSSGGSSGGSSSSSSGSSGGAVQSPSGAMVSSTTTTAADGSKVTTTTITLGGKTMTAVTQVTALANGASQRVYTVSGDVSGLTFAGVGTVSADGTTLTTPEGQTYMVTSAPMMIVTNADGTTVGCFVDPVTGQPVAFGYDTVLMQLGADGQMHAHWIKADGTFYTGTVVMNGMMIVFNEEGVMVSYSLLAM